MIIKKIYINEDKLSLLKEFYSNPDSDKIDNAFNIRLANQKDKRNALSDFRKNRGQLHPPKVGCLSKGWYPLTWHVDKCSYWVLVNPILITFFDIFP